MAHNWLTRHSHNAIGTYHKVRDTLLHCTRSTLTVMSKVSVFSHIQEHSIEVLPVIYGRKKRTSVKVDKGRIPKSRGCTMKA